MKARCYRDKCCRVTVDNRVTASEVAYLNCTQLRNKTSLALKHQAVFLRALSSVDLVLEDNVSEDFIKYSVTEIRGLSYNILQEHNLTSLVGVDKVEEGILFKLRENRTKEHHWKLKIQASCRNVRESAYSVQMINKSNSLKRDVIYTMQFHFFKGKYET